MLSGESIALIVFVLGALGSVLATIMFQKKKEEGRIVIVVDVGSQLALFC